MGVVDADDSCEKKIVPSFDNCSFKLLLPGDLP